MQSGRDVRAVFLAENSAGEEETRPARSGADQVFTFATIGLGVLAILSVAAVVLSFWWS